MQAATRRLLVHAVVVWPVLLLVPAVLTVLRYTADDLNADGVEQSFMSVQGPALFYWGQDRLVPVISILASPVSDPTWNLWLCLTLQALSLYALLALVAQRTAANLGYSGLWPTLLTYLVLAVTTNAVFSVEMMQSFAIEGQPYALSWLLVLLSYEGWKSERYLVRVLGLAAAMVALGVNPSVLLLAAFLAFTDCLRNRRIVVWVLYLGALAAMFVVWTYLSSRYAMYPTPQREDPPSYFGFSVGTFSSGLSLAVDGVVSHLRPLRTVVALLVGLLGLVLVQPRVRARIVSFGAFFAGFTLVYVALFAGNEWVMLNGYPYRYFFPLPLALVLAVGVPVAAAVLQVETSRTAWPVRRPVLRLAALAAAVLATAVAMAGPLTPPQDADVFEGTQPTQEFARAHDVRFLAGAYWNLWPLGLGLLDEGRDAVFVAGFKSEGDRAANQRVLDGQLAEDGQALALCVNQDVEVCIDYLDHWTRPGWRSTGRECPAPPVVAPADTSGNTARKCKVLFQRDAAS